VGDRAAERTRMDRLSYWRVAAWVALCLSGLAVAAALVLPGAFRRDATHRPQIRASLTPRTHLFGQPVIAIVEVPAGSSVNARFTPYRIVGRSTVHKRATVQYRFTLQCLGSACAGAPGAEQEIALPPARIGLPNGKRLEGVWPPLRVASRLGPNDLDTPAPRGDLSVPQRSGPDRALGLGLLAGAGAALIAGALLGVLWLAPQRLPFRLPERRVNRGLSDLRYALVVTGLAAGSGPDDRRAALESLAVALDQEGHRELAAEARSLAWSPGEPRGEAVRQIAASAQRLARDDS
jgi:hypothetical protein